MESESPSNSKAPRPKAGAEEQPREKKHVEKIVKGNVIRRKKPWHKRFAEKFSGGEDAGTVLEYVFFDIIVEAGKDIVLDAFNAGIERKFYGEVRSAGRRGYNRGRANYGRTDYNRISSGSILRNDPRPEPRMSRRARATHDFGEIVLPTRVEANEIIDQLFELCSRYEVATVADLYDMIGEPSNMQDQKWGWDDMRGSDSERVRDGYLLVLPRPKPID